MKTRYLPTLLIFSMSFALNLGYTPAMAQQSSSFPTQIVAQSDDGEIQEEQVETEENGQGDSEQVSESQETSETGTAGPFTNLASMLFGQEGGSREPVSLATLFVQYVGLGILIVFLVAIPISFNCLLCALIWKVGMVARGGKKPSIG